MTVTVPGAAPAAAGNKTITSRARIRKDRMEYPFVPVFFLLAIDPPSTMP
jgi:hypothetical protein